MSDSLILDFGNLPLVEAAIRIGLSEDLALKYTSIYEWHAQLENDFARISEPQLDERPPGELPGGFRISRRPALPGVVFEGNSLGLIASVQRRVVAVRWVRQFGGVQIDYPRFGSLRDLLWRIIDVIDSPQRVAVMQAINMSYVNFIEVADASSVLSDYFSDAAQVGMTASCDQLHQVELSWREADVDLRFRLNRTNVDDGEGSREGYELTTIAGVAVSGEPSQVASRLEFLHFRLQDFFYSLLSEKAKTEWQLKRRSSEDGC